MIDLGLFCLLFLLVSACMGVVFILTLALRALWTILRPIFKGDSWRDRQ